MSFPAWPRFYLPFVFITTQWNPSNKITMETMLRVRNIEASVFWGLPVYFRGYKVQLLMGIQTLPEQNIHQNKLSAFQRLGIAVFHCTQKRKRG